MLLSNLNRDLERDSAWYKSKYLSPNIGMFPSFDSRNPRFVATSGRSANTRSHAALVIAACVAISKPEQSKCAAIVTRAVTTKRAFVLFGTLAIAMTSRGISFAHLGYYLDPGVLRFGYVV